VPLTGLSPGGNLGGLPPLGILALRESASKKAGQSAPFILVSVSFSLDDG